jgi:hypothetical protein
VTIITHDSSDELYAGCYARASVNPFVPKKWRKTLAIGLNNVQKLGDGERLDSFSSAEDSPRQQKARRGAGPRFTC